jgi:hypothetical protein
MASTDDVRSQDTPTVAGAVILATAIVLSPALASCSAGDCAYYGSPDANTRCVVISAPVTGAGP